MKLSLKDIYAQSLHLLIAGIVRIEYDLTSNSVPTGRNGRVGDRELVGRMWLGPRVQAGGGEG